MRHPRSAVEVALPLEVLDTASAGVTSVHHGHRSVGSGRRPIPVVALARLAS